jgi:stage V sporulation protein R
MPAGGFNPYKIGIELYKDIERRWNNGQHGHTWENLDSLGAKEHYNDNSNQGRAKIFEVRRIYNDVTFIEEFLTPEFVERLGLFQTKRDENTGEVRVASRDFHRVKQTLLHFLTNRGEPFIYAVDGNYLNRGELYLAHQFAGVELDAAKAEQVLANMRLLWGRPVHLQMRFRDDMFLFSCDQPGDTVRRERISDETPAPAHILT